MKKILFCATTPMSYAMFKPVHKKLKQDRRIEIWFTANHNTQELYSTVGLDKENIIGKYRSMFNHYDLCICPSFFYERKNATTKVQIFHGCSLKNRAVHKKALAYDKLFLIGPYMKQKFISTWGLSEDDSRFEEIGMPKLDAFFDNSIDREKIEHELGLDKNLPTVIYAPTRPSMTSSSLQMFGRDIIAAVEQMPVNFLIKLHDRALKKWRPKMKQDWTSILKHYDGHPRVRVIRDYDIVPYLFISDLLISDISSVINEFCLLNRPMVLIDVPRLISFHKRKELKRGVASSDLENWGRDPGLLIRKVNELQRAVSYCLAHPEEKEKIRKEFGKKFFYNPGRATQKAVEKIYELLHLEPLA